MSELKDKLAAQYRAAHLAFARLTERERLLVLAAGAFVVVLLLSVTGLLVTSAIGAAEHRVRVKTDQLTQLLTLQGEYRAREAERRARLRELGRTNVRLVSLVEDIARQCGVVIGQLRPEDSAPNAEGIVESRVELRATNVSADRLESFLSRLETAPGLLVIRRLKLSRPFRKDAADVELTATTYRLKTP